MNTILLKRNSSPDVSDELSAALSREFGLSEKIIEVLASRGFTDSDALKKYLNPSENDLHDPFLLSGMRETVDRINQVIDNKEKVIIYGDYDCDGVSAVAILTKFLVSRGVDVFPYIPNRTSDGYGLNVNTLETLIGELAPDLIITCDCGISAANEIEYVLDLGVDVIVTDHHEIPPVVPNCVIINPKLANQRYPFDRLCGAGVVLKIVHACAGLETAKEYLDLCALAAVADLVPLVDENRTIVYLALASMNGGKACPGLRRIFKFLELSEVCAGDIAFKIAPRINAAGRMGDAGRAFQLLISDNVAEIDKLIAEIDGDNERRKLNCVTIYDEAVEDLAGENLVDDYAVILSHPSWERGLTSIAAAQLASEYRRPAFMLVQTRDNLYKGSARSVDGVNLYEVLESVSDLLSEFGGHNQAAGFSLEIDKLPEFKRRINEFLRTHYPRERFLPYNYYDAVVDGQSLNMSLAHELKRLEPFGSGNPRPVFKIKADAFSAAVMKNKPRHIILTLDGSTQINGFNYGKFAEQFNIQTSVELLVEAGVNNFRGRDYLSLSLRDFDFDRLSAARGNERLSAQRLLQLRYLNLPPAEYITAEFDSVKQYVDNDRLFGTLIIAYDFAAYERAISSGLVNDRWLHNYLSYSAENNYNRIILGADFSDKVRNYDTVILLGLPLCGGAVAALSKNLPRARIIAVPLTGRNIFAGLKTDRETFVDIYNALKSFRGEGRGVADIYLQVVTDGRITVEQFVFCYLVFQEIGLIEESNEPFSFRLVKTVKADINSSKILNFVKDNAFGEHTSA
ncbi:MAG: single-stranded-DNA-specific exonuclease RecJ [Clostridiales bacterium]|jgi:single-stranded-DNA-specific exonuclease|nr:single-stranded-DNA-specific exonuclease RecJ [Clostridiales bacterium]